MHSIIHYCKKCYKEQFEITKEEKRIDKRWALTCSMLLCVFFPSAAIIGTAIAFYKSCSVLSLWLIIVYVAYIVLVVLSAYTRSVMPFLKSNTLITGLSFIVSIILAAWGSILLFGEDGRQCSSAMKSDKWKAGFLYVESFISLIILYIMVICCNFMFLKFGILFIILTKKRKNQIKQNRRQVDAPVSSNSNPIVTDEEKKVTVTEIKMKTIPSIFANE